jgi:hypothetical protein
MAPVITEEQDEEIAIDDETAHQISVGMYHQIWIFTLHFVFSS